MIITFIGFKITFSNMGHKTTPSLISKGGYQIHPPPGREGNRHPLGNRVKEDDECFEEVSKVFNGSLMSVSRTSP